MFIYEALFIVVYVLCYTFLLTIIHFSIIDLHYSILPSLDLWIDVLFTTTIDNNFADESYTHQLNHKLHGLAIV